MLTESYQKTIYVTYILTTLSTAAFYMPNLSLPYLTKANGVSDATYGYALSLGGVLQVIGAPYYGKLIQTYGVKRSLYLSYTCVLLMTLIVTLSQSTFWLFFSRLPMLFIHPPTAYQTLLSKLTSPGEERTKAFGRFGFAIGFGLSVAPIFAQVFTPIFGLIGAFLCTILICLASFLLTFLYVEEPESGESKKTDDQKPQAPSKNSYKDLFSRPNVLRFLLRKTLVVVPIFVAISVIQLHMINEFHMPQNLYAVYQFASGTSLMLINAFGVQLLRSKFSELQLMFLGGLSGLFTMFQFCFWANLWQLFLIVPSLTLALTLTNVVADSIMTSSVKDEEQSLILGLLRSIETGSRTVGPAVGGYVLQHHGFGLIGLIGALSTIGSIFGHFI